MIPGTQDQLKKEKKALRDVMRARRLSFAKENPEAGILAAAVLLQTLSFQPGDCFVGYKATAGEIDIEPIMTKLLSLGLVLGLPCVTAPGEPLLFRSYQPGDGLQAGVWGIQEPLSDHMAVEPNWLLVPLVAFDRRGGRLGQGGGYYDRTLARLRRQRTIRAIGVGFSVQEVEQVPTLPGDERLDYILTEKEFIDPSAA